MDGHITDPGFIHN